MNLFKAVPEVIASMQASQRLVMDDTGWGLMGFANGPENAIRSNGQFVRYIFGVLNEVGMCTVVESEEKTLCFMYHWHRPNRI